MSALPQKRTSVLLRFPPLHGGKLIAAETEKWAKVIELTGIKAAE
jgi:hypothetical protein